MGAKEDPARDWRRDENQGAFLTFSKIRRLWGTAGNRWQGKAEVKIVLRFQERWIVSRTLSR